MLQIVLSGPASQRKNALKVLQDAGFQVVLDEYGESLSHSWGMAANHETIVVDGVPVAGPDPRVPVSFVTVLGEDADRAAQFVEPLKWRLRAHAEVN